MIEWLSRNIVSWQIKKNILTSDNRSLYQYAYEVLFNQIVNVLIAILIAIVMHAPITVFIFLASYMPLRSYCGGYHARTHGGCTIVSALLVIVVCLIDNVIKGSLNFIFPLICFAVSGALVWWLAPVPDKNKPLDEKETVRYRKKSRQVWFTEVVLGMIFGFISANVSAVIALSHIIMSIMLGYGALKNYKQ